jgi:hypothetical protein
MIRKFGLGFLLAASFLSIQARAQNFQDAGTYCTYLLEQAQAQRDFLRTPTASGGLTQPETGLPTQVVGGASLGLSDVKKAALTMEAARRNCDLYKSTVGAEQQVQYASAALEKDALRNRLALIEQASTQLDALMDKTRKMMAEQNATRLMLFSLETTKIKLEADRTDTQSKIAAIYTPQLSDTPLKDLVTEKQNNEVAEQQAQDRLNRQNNWDVSLQVGVHQQVNPVADNPQPYGAVSVSYNLGSRAIDRHLDRAAAAYGDWKKVEEGDVARNVEILRQQLTDNIAVDEAKLQALAKQMQEIDTNLAAVANPDTSAAFDFNNQLAAAKLLLEIEIGDATNRLAGLRAYMAKNF